MNPAVTRLRALYRKELREYRRNRAIVATMASIPLGIVLFPLIEVIAIPASASGALLNGDPLVILLGIPAMVPSTIASYAVVGEREQGTLEPLLTTPLQRDELLLAKALAALTPSLVISYAMYGFFLLCTKLFAQPAVASAVIRLPFLLVQVLFTPLVALLSIWFGVAISARSNDVRVAQQLGALTGLPVLVAAYLIALGTVRVSPAAAFGAAAALLILDVIGLRIAAAVFHRERLITGSH